MQQSFRWPRTQTLVAMTRTLVFAGVILTLPAVTLSVVLRGGTWGLLGLPILVLSLPLWVAVALRVSTRLLPPRLGAHHWEINSSSGTVAATAALAMMLSFCCCWFPPVLPLVGFLMHNDPSARNFWTVGRAWRAAVGFWLVVAFLGVIRGVATADPMGGLLAIFEDRRAPELVWMGVGEGEPRDNGKMDIWMASIYLCGVVVWMRHLDPLLSIRRWPSVLYLRRFGAEADQHFTGSLLSALPSGWSAVWLFATRPNPLLWEPMGLILRGLRWGAPLRSAPVVLVAEDNRWEEDAARLIEKARVIVLDCGDSSKSLTVEIGLISQHGRWAQTIILLPEGRSAPEGLGEGAVKVTYRSLPQSFGTKALALGAAMLGALPLLLLPWVVVLASWLRNPMNTAAGWVVAGGIDMVLVGGLAAVVLPPLGRPRLDPAAEVALESALWGFAGQSKASRPWEMWVWLVGICVLTFVMVCGFLSVFLGGRLADLSQRENRLLPAELCANRLSVAPPLDRVPVPDCMVFATTPSQGFITVTASGRVTDFAVAVGHGDLDSTWRWREKVEADTLAFGSTSLPDATAQIVPDLRRPTEASCGVWSQGGVPVGRCCSDILGHNFVTACDLNPATAGDPAVTQQLMEAGAVLARDLPDDGWETLYRQAVPLTPG